MSDFVPVSQASLQGAVPALLGGAGTLEGLTGARPRSASSFVPAQSFAPWKPSEADESRLPCALPTKKGHVCKMARAYDPNDQSILTPFCQAHWNSIFYAANQALMGAHLMLATPPPD